MTDYAESPNYYQILGINRTASTDEIREAYRKLARKYHPDRNPGFQKEAEQKFKEVELAYATLIDDSKRYRYDRELEEKESRATEDSDKPTPEPNTDTTAPRWWRFYKRTEPYPGDEHFSWTDQAPGWWRVMWGSDPYPGDEFFEDLKKAETKKEESKNAESKKRFLINILKMATIGSLSAYLITAAIVAILWFFESLALPFLTRHWLVSTTVTTLLITLVPPIIVLSLKICKQDASWDWDTYWCIVGLAVAAVVIIFSILFTLSRPPVFVFLRQYAVSLSIAIVVVAISVATIIETIERN